MSATGLWRPSWARWFAACLATTAITVLVPSATAAPAPPANDDFADALVIDGAYVNLSRSTVGATAQPGEPRHAGQPPGASIWFRVDARSNTSFSLSSYLLGASGDGVPSALAVYTGTLLSTLTPVAAAHGTDNRVRVAATVARTYWIAVTGAGGSTGSAALHLSEGAVNDDFGSALPLTGLSGTTDGSTVGTYTEDDDPRIGGVRTHGSVWYRWQAPTSGRVRFATTGSEFDTVLGVFTGAQVDDLAVVADNDDCEAPVGTLDSCLSFDGTAGATYRLVVAGAGPAFGGFRLTWRYRDDPCTLTGTAGDDVLVGTPGQDVICGMGGNDVITGAGGDDSIVGGAGRDSAAYTGARGGVTASLVGGWAAGQGSDILSQVENLVGSAYADRLTGDAAGNTLNGGSGADRLLGRGGVDTLFGAEGDDLVDGGWNGDRLNGGPGTDTAAFGDRWPARVDLTAGTATTGTSAADTITLVEDVVGTPRGDLIVGSAGPNRLVGGGGDDVLSGRGGDDALLGGDGSDACGGGAGTDTADSCEQVVDVP